LSYLRQMFMLMYQHIWNVIVACLCLFVSKFMLKISSFLFFWFSKNLGLGNSGLIQGMNVLRVPKVFNYVFTFISLKRH
jgi:hypothetical protein